MGTVQRELLWPLGYTRLLLLCSAIKFYIIFSYKAFICIIVTTHSVLLFSIPDEGVGLLRFVLYHTSSLTQVSSPQQTPTK